VAAGWGSISSKKTILPDKLHDVDIELIERNTCLKIPGYTNQISEKMVCGGHLEGGKDSCQGDSGGPLMCQLNGPGSPWIIYGITSWGVGCARAYTPGVYVKVSVFIDWIEEQTGVKPGLEVDSYRNLLPYEPNVKTIKG
jgi:secreted trypsin-like serine protease